MTNLISMLDHEQLQDERKNRNDIPPKVVDLFDKQKSVWSLSK